MGPDQMVDLDFVEARTDQRSPPRAERSDSFQRSAAVLGNAGSRSDGEAFRFIKDKLRGRAVKLDFAFMTKAHELRLAKRTARLGTETAFEVLVKARALEAKGRDIVHLE